MMPPPDALGRLVGDMRQIASVRRFVLSEGPEAGIETLAFSTGGGLDFWVTVGRMLDIATLSWRGTQLAWQSPAGLRRPPALPPAESERIFNRAFGGFLNTCGFDHIRQPADGRPLHGSAPFTPARLVSCGEDWGAKEPILYCEGEVIAWAFDSGGYRLRRRIEAPVRGSMIRLRDTVEVIGPDALPILALYHFNLGYPLHDEGTEIRLGEKPVAGPLPQHEATVAPSSLHPVFGQRAACSIKGGGGTVLEVQWRTETLPWLQLWRDLRPGAGVLSVEPCSVGRDALSGNSEVSPVRPGHTKSFEIDCIVHGQ